MQNLSRRRSVWLTIGACCVAVFAQLLASAATGEDEGSGLWHVVNDLCVPMQKALNRPFPCLDVDTRRGFVLLRAPLDQSRLLIVPTRRIHGIESPALQQGKAPPLWSIGWSERDRVAAALGQKLQWDDIGMAVNSRPRRTQDQLHIHIDCVSPWLRQKLTPKAAHLTGQWSELDLRPWADRYRIKAITQAELEQNLFKMVADEIPGAREDMALQSIAVVGLPGGEAGQRLAILVNSGGGHAEELLDHSCSILRQNGVKPAAFAPGK